MIYFDNAATTMQKPEAVVQAVCAAMTQFGGVGRGVHGASLAAGMTVYEARDSIAKLLGAPSASRVSFAGNVTEALNIALFGLLGPAVEAGEPCHAITTAASHNSVLRPLYALQDQGMELSVAPINADGSVDMDAFEDMFQPNTKVVAVTHASNLTGDVYDIARMAQVAHAHGAIIVVDSAQTAGVVPIDMGTEALDVVCFTGHKALYGPQGTGGLALAEGIEIRPFKVGGSGVHSYDKHHPTLMPEGLEAGTINGHGIAGLGAGVNFVMETGVEAICAHEMELVARFEAGVADIPGIKLLGARVTEPGKVAGVVGRTGVVALNIGDEDAGRISDALNFQYEICTRAGAHCAPLMHGAMGTVEQGAVRFSFSYFNTADEVDQAIVALREIAAALV